VDDKHGDIVLLDLHPIWLDSMRDVLDEMGMTVAAATTVLKMPSIDSHDSRRGTSCSTRPSVTVSRAGCG